MRLAIVLVLACGCGGVPVPVLAASRGRALAAVESEPSSAATRPAVDCGGAELRVTMEGELAGECMVPTRCDRELMMRVDNCTSTALEIQQLKLASKDGGGYGYDFATDVLVVPAEASRAFPYGWSHEENRWAVGSYELRIIAGPSHPPSVAWQPGDPPIIQMREAKTTFEITELPK